MDTSFDEYDDSAISDINNVGDADSNMDRGGIISITNLNTSY